MGIGLKDIIAKLNGGASTPTSCRSSDTPDEPSMSPNSLSDGDGDLPFTIGVTDATPHACHFCDKAFHRHQHLKLHEQEHSTSKQQFECQYCPRKFRHKRSRDRHLKLHTGECKYKCTKCDNKYSRSDHLHIHMRTHENGKPYPCAICGRGYSTAASLTSHLSSHKKEALGKGLPPPGKPYKCLVCNEYFRTSQALQEHGIIHQDGQTAARTLRCNFCSENFASTEQLREHVRANHVPETQGRCSVCSETFEDLDDLLKHKKVHGEASNSGHASTSPRPFNCLICRKGYASEEALKRHLKTHRSRQSSRGTPSPLSNPRVTPDARSSPSSSKPYSCEFCKMTFAELRNLQEHTLVVHWDLGNSSKDSEMYCPHCNANFGDPFLLMEHVRVVHKERPHQEKRGKGNIGRTPWFNLSEPINNGPASNPFLCSNCNAALPNFEEFREHLKRHLAPYHPSQLTCFLCGERAFSEEHYLAHVSTHYRSPATEFRCQGCSKAFPEPDQLQKHLMDQHAVQLYRCNVCNNVFDSKVNLQLHFSSSHSNTSRVCKCNSCDLIFPSELEFQVHVKMVHMVNNLAFRCPLCNQCFASEPEFNLHYQEHRTFSCNYCREEFHVEFLLDRHVQEKHTKEYLIPFPRSEANGAQDLSLKASPKDSYRCDLCDATFAVESALNAHRSQAHNISRASSSQKQGQTALSLDCAYCHEPFKSRTELANHTKSHCASSSKHKCNICDELFPSAATLSEHKLSHLKGDTYRNCGVCHHLLRDEQDFYVHFHEHNVDDIPAPCVICRQTLLTPQDVKVHAKHHLKIQDTCCVCGKNIPTQMMIINGTSESHSFMCKDCFRSSETANRCDECCIKFENPEALLRHKASHLMPKTFQCIKCQLSFKSESEIQSHVRSHLLQEGNDHRCLLCDTILDSPAKLQCHLIEHSFEGAKGYTCYLCDTVFTGSHLLQQHMVEHSPREKPFRCDFCPLTFFFGAELNNHSRGHSEFTGSLQNYHCHCCVVSFPSQRLLQQHLKGHERFALTRRNAKVSQTSKDFTDKASTVTHTCPVCKEFFPRYKDLKLHVRKHPRPFRCGSCKMSFFSQNDLSAHQEKHPHYPCEQCGKSFATEELVTEHMRLHITSTTHPCEMCSETFESLARLKEHLVSSHGKRFEHSCSVCSEVFESSEALEHHAQKEHPSPMDVESAESMSGQSTSSSGDTKDGDSSECTSNMEESDTRDSPLSVAETHAVSQAVS